MLYCAWSMAATATASASCHVLMARPQLAQGHPQAVDRPPTSGWVDLHRLPDIRYGHAADPRLELWYKIHWYYHCSNGSKQPLTLLVNRINGAGQIFLNGEFLWQDQSLGAPLSISGNMPRYWHLAASSLHFGENQLMIKVRGGNTQATGLDHVLIGPDSSIMQQYRNFWLMQQSLPLAHLICCFSLAIVAFIVWLFCRQESVFGWFSLNALASGLLIGYTLMVELPFGLSSSQMARGHAMLFMLYVVSSCMFAWRLAARHLPQIECTAFVLLGLVSLIGLSIPNFALADFLNFAYAFSMLILLANFASYPYLAFQAKNCESYFLAVIFVFFLVITLHDLATRFNLNHDRVWLAYTAPLNTLLLAVILAKRLASKLRKIERFNHNLEHRVNLAKSELHTTLSQQHLLALERIKLQERINIAHDLHDSLGGTLVRSIALLNQSTHNLSNQQFLSMLKALSNDLRHIIDADSSTGMIAPATPTLWGAAIRYRFKQIFDELQIESQWSFPPAWSSPPPTMLECLTLLRVMEECLTNIIKHSHAQKVRISLSYVAQQQLKLEIADDGAGFDVEAVMASNLSIGIRGIRHRLEKINATLKIDSTSRQTLVQVITAPAVPH
jgi:two-component system sensor histidine kinase UhpB